MGSLIFARPDANRTAFAEEDGTIVLAIGANPGQPYRPLGLELWAPMQQLYKADDYAAVADRAADVLAADPPYGAVHYNFACAASRAGRPDEALTYLRRGLELNPELRESATRSSALDDMRGDARFQELMGDSE